MQIWKPKYKMSCIKMLRTLPADKHSPRRSAHYLLGSPPCTADTSFSVTVGQTGETPSSSGSDSSGLEPTGVQFHTCLSS